MSHPLSAFLVSFLAATGSQESSEPGFRNASDASGVAAIVDAAYARHPDWWLSGLHLVDLDGDGDLDLFLSAHGKGSAVAALNSGKGVFTEAKGRWPESELHLAYDLDEDGKIDLNTTHMDGGARWWMNQTASGELAFKATDQLRPTNAGRINVMADFDRDGRVDWLRSQARSLVFDKGEAGGTFREAAHRLPIVQDYRFEVAVMPGDLDGDGDLDLVLEWGRYAFPNGKCRIYRNDGDLKFTNVTGEAGLYEDGLSVKGIGDVDHDGDTDLVALEKKAFLSVFLNDGKGRFAKKEGAVRGVKGRASMASWGIAGLTDFDNDGRGDLIVNGKHFLKVLRGLGGGSFEYANPAWGIKDVSSSSVDDGICFGDVDGDGDLDVIGYRNASSPRRVNLYRNALAKKNWIRVRPVGTAGNRGASGAKIRLTDPESGALLWFEQVGIFARQEAQSYYMLAETERHFGLGDRAGVDVSVVFYPSGKTVTRTGVTSGTTLRVEED